MVELLIRVFEARLLRLIPGDEGKFRHGKVRAEDPVVTLADALGGAGQLPEVRFTPMFGMWTRSLGGFSLQARLWIRHLL